MSSHYLFSVILDSIKALQIKLDTKIVFAFLGFSVVPSIHMTQSELTNISIDQDHVSLNLSLEFVKWLDNVHWFFYVLYFYPIWILSGIGKAILVAWISSIYTTHFKLMNLTGWTSFCTGLHEHIEWRFQGRNGGICACSHWWNAGRYKTVQQSDKSLLFHVEISMKFFLFFAANLKQARLFHDNSLSSEDTYQPFLS